MKWPSKYSFLIGFVFLLPIICLSQTKDSISVNFKDLPLEIILDSISIKSSYDFSYNSEIIPPGSLYSYKRDKIDIESLLDILLVGTGVEYVRIESQIILRKSRLSQSYESSEELKKVTIYGWVRDEETKKPIIGANVYIKGSTIGTRTDDNGNYKIVNIDQGNYSIVFSHVGYMTNSYSIKSEASNPLILNALMKERVEILKEVEVVSAPLVSKVSEIKRHFKTFNQELLGTSQNSLQSEIMNPDILSYTYSESTDFLHVIAQDALIVNNYALGYKIIMDLDFFNKRKEVINFHGQARYESMQPENRKQRKKWVKNRKTAYQGSMIHFFKSLVNDRLKKNGYKIWITDNIDGDLNKVDLNSVLSLNEDGRNWLLKFNGYLYVEYYHEEEQRVFVAETEGLPKELSDLAITNNQVLTIKGPQKSYIKLKDGEILIDSNGKIEDRLSIISYGYWSWERLGDLMPIDFDPKVDIF